MAGLTLLHVSVNTLNEYFDYKTGIDLRTVKTPFSGGSGMLPAGLLQPSAVLKLGLICFGAAAVVGCYFLAVVGLILAPILALGALFTLGYTQLLTRVGLGEVAAGLGLGALPVVGAYLVHTGFYTADVFQAAVPPGILTFNLLFLNEFPDLEADRAGGRRNLVMLLGLGRASTVYKTLTAFVYAYLAMGIMFNWYPKAMLLCFATIPLAFKASKNLQPRLNDFSRLVEALKANVMVVLATQSLMALAYILPV